MTARLIAFLTFTSLAVAQQTVVHRLISDSNVQSLLDFVETNEERVIGYQIELTEIPAPPFEEASRAAAYAEMFRARGLEDVRIDAEGNVLGRRPGRSSRPHLVLSAHLDTVFPAETDVSVKRTGAVLAAPGVGDDGRGLAVLLGVVDALLERSIETDGPITFVGTVGEEGLGDLRGVKHLFEDELEGRIDRFVSIDGTRNGITVVGVGSYRYRVAFLGPGGHSYGSFGMPNPIHALGRLIADIADFHVSDDPKTTFSVGRLGGGTSVNSIPFEAWFEVDMRSSDEDALETIHAKFQAAAEKALAEERARWLSAKPLDIKLERVGFRPAGSTPADSPIVEAAVEATRVLGLEPSIRAGSTDANVGMSLGVPSVTIGGGGSGEGAHSPGETFDTTDSYKGTQRALLVTLALSSEL